MKSYAIYDKDIENTSCIGYLLYYENANECVIELEDWLDEWNAPLLFQSLVRDGIFTVPKNIAWMWLSERVIPSGRQNIGSILKNARLKEYNEFNLFNLSKGISSQDNCFAEPIQWENIPENIRDRQKKNLIECYVSSENTLICTFADDVVVRVNLKKAVEEIKELTYLIGRAELLETVQVDIGGYGIVFNGNIVISATELRAMGDELGIKASEINAFVSKNLLNSSEVCSKLGCTRQNLSYLVNAGQIKPIVKGNKENHYTKGEIAKASW